MSKGAISDVLSSHTKVESGSGRWNSKTAIGLFVYGGGTASKITAGATVSTVNGRVAGVGSVMPERVARTENVYRPSVSGPYAFGDAQLVYVPVVAPGPSSLHSNVDPDSVAVNRYEGEVTLVGPEGPPVSCVSGVFGPGGLVSGGSPWKRAIAKSPPDVVPTTTSFPSAWTAPSTPDSLWRGSAKSVVCLPLSENVASSVPSVLKRARPSALPICPKVTILPLLASATPYPNDSA